MFFWCYFVEAQSDSFQCWLNFIVHSIVVVLTAFEELNNNYIILDCKHTFNYDAIFKEVCIQKMVINKKETQKLPKYNNHKS